MRFYLIGAGVIAGTHMEAIRKLDLPELEVKVTDVNPAVLSAFLARYPETVGVWDAAVMLEEPARENDIVIVCTPPSTHFALASMALESGRSVLCEKPLTTNAEDARVLLKLAREKGVYLGCCSNRFMLASKYKAIQQVLEAGEIGNPYKMTLIHRANRSRSGIEYQPQTRWFLNRAVAGGGTLLDWGPYDFAIVHDWLKPVRAVVHGAWISQPETGRDPEDAVFDVETHVSALICYELEYGRKIWLQYERASCTHGEAYAHTEIEGSIGSVRWDSYYSGDQVTVVKDSAGEPVAETKECGDEGYDPMEIPVRTFTDLIRGKDNRALVNEEAVFNLLLLQAIYQCAETGKQQTVERLELYGG